MQTTGLPSRVHVSQDFYHDVGQPGLFVDAGVHDVKGKGAMRTYYWRDEANKMHR